MYKLINQHIDAVLKQINQENDVQRYVWLMEKLPDVDVTKDPAFQHTYRQHWQLNPARLSPQFIETYFAHLQSLKGRNDVDIEAVARYLFALPIRDGIHSLQFSFATKLVHMLKPSQPIYDSMVATFFFYFPGTPKEPMNVKLTRLISFYRFLFDEYDRVLRFSLLAPSIARFRAHCQIGPIYSDQKVIDTLIWKFVYYLKQSGGITKRAVVYS